MSYIVMVCYKRLYGNNAYGCYTVNVMRLRTFLAIAIVSLSFLIVPTTVYASERCGDVNTSYIPCDILPGKPSSIEKTEFWWLLGFLLDIAIGLVGVVAVGGIVWSAIMYATAADNTSQTQQAKEIIREVVIGLIVSICIYALLQYLIPGGIF